MLDRELLGRVGRLSALAFELAFTVVLGVILGSWLDAQLSTSPLLLLSLAVGSLVIGMVRLTASLKREVQDDGLPPDDQP